MEDFADDPNAYDIPRAAPPPDITAYLERLLGWEPERRATVTAAADSVELARQRRSHLALIGSGDLVPIAFAIHWRTMGTAKFVVVDPRRREDPCTKRLATKSLPTLSQAIDAARGGTVCIRSVRKPADWGVARSRLAADDVRLTVCYPVSKLSDIELSRPAPVVVPSIAGRDIDRLVDEYEADARTDLGSPSMTLTSPQRAWIAVNCQDHHAIDVAVRRFLAISSCKGVSASAHRLGMAPISLLRWMRRRGLTAEMVLGLRPLPAR